MQVAADAGVAGRAAGGIDRSADCRAVIRLTSFYPERTELTVSRLRSRLLDIRSRAVDYPLERQFDRYDGFTTGALTAPIPA